MSSLENGRRPLPMTPRDWFGVALRVLGVWMLLEATSALLQAFYASRISDLGAAANRSTVNYYLTYAVVDFAIGLFLLRWPSFVIGLAYDEPQRGRDDAEPADASATGAAESVPED